MIAGRPALARAPKATRCPDGKIRRWLRLEFRSLPARLVLTDSPVAQQAGLDQSLLAEPRRG